MDVPKKNERPLVLCSWCGERERERLKIRKKKKKKTRSSFLVVVPTRWAPEASVFDTVFG